MERLLSLATLSFPGGEGNYYMAIAALTPKEVIAQTRQSTDAADAEAMSPPSPALIYFPFVVFFVIFVLAFGMQLMGKVKSLRHTVTAMVIALFIAMTPFVLTSIREGVGLGTQAGPEQIPRNVRIVQTGKDTVLVTWDTDAASVGAVRIGPGLSQEKDIIVKVGDFGNRVHRHTIKLERLEPGIRYEMEILSGTVWYTDKGNPLKILLSGKR
jgi:hypothetical protein